MVYALDKMITKEKRDILMKSAYILNTINEDDQFKTLKELQEDAGYCIESQFYKELKELIAV